MLEEAQEEEALLFLQKCVPPTYKYVIQGCSSLIACFQRLEALCTDERMYAERSAAQRNPINSHENLEGTWVNQDSYKISAQILLGADHARYFPHEVRNKNGDLLQTEPARLMQSAIISNYIIFG